MKRFRVFKWFLSYCVLLCVNLWLSNDYLLAQQGCPEIPRRLPPRGLEIPANQTKGWSDRIAKQKETLSSFSSEDQTDVSVLLKSVEYAMRFNEFYVQKDFKKADRLLDLADERLRMLKQGQSDWREMQGRQVRGFVSSVDGSVQPVGFVFPNKQKKVRSRKVPLYVWLHGRGDKKTDLHFLCERLDRDGQITPEDAIVLHPFGRQCVGYKSAGETDVMEAIDFACSQYPIDEDRIVLMGFSMGGAGVWHIAAHYGERFVAASPGAGFAETAEYQNLKPENFPPKYEQTLWSVYDVPGYTRNLFNLPVVAYSGEKDKQIQAARVMERAYEQEGNTLPHLIGPGMGHKYHPDTLREILARMKEAARQERPTSPKLVQIQTKHLRYGSRNGIVIDGQLEAYADTRVSAMRTESRVRLDTKNVSRITVDPKRIATPEIAIGKQTFSLGSEQLTLANRNGIWGKAKFELMRKRPKLSGPIDDAFIDPFMVVLPNAAPLNDRVGSWVDCELKNFMNRWAALFRGEVRFKAAPDVTAEDMRKYHLVLWGDPKSNELIGRFCNNQRSPIRWGAEQLEVGGKKASSNNHVPVLVFPNLLAIEQGVTQDAQLKYVVINSGPTFRQAHDRTNSLQNPHLPDWAIVGLDRAPDDETPGRIEAARFFDQSWK